MIRVRTPSRLHFGLLSFPLAEQPAPHWPNLHGEAIIPARRFGGVGLMLEHPGLTLRGEPAGSWKVGGPLAERALAYARRFAQSAGPAAGSPMHLVVEAGAREHAGLGTGTQLGLAVARILATAWNLPGLDIIELAHWVDRGSRSALGIHGFVHGGFLVDGGKGRSGMTAPLIARVPFPEAWRIVVILASGAEGLHGSEESGAFERLWGQGPSLTRTEGLCRLVLLGLLPALAEEDLQAFGEALYDFNARVGAGFAPVQGGVYASARTTELVGYFRRQGIPGAGQSSWGPTIFAVVADVDRAESLARRVRKRFALGEHEVIVTQASNRGAVVVTPKSSA